MNLLKDRKRYSLKTATTVPENLWGFTAPENLWGFTAPEDLRGFIKGKGIWIYNKEKQNDR